MTNYHVDKEQVGDYIKSRGKRSTTVFVIVGIVIISLQTFNGKSLDGDFPFGVMIIGAIIISIAFYIGNRSTNNKLKQLSDGKFFIDQSLITFEAADGKTKVLKLDEIAVIHKKHYGTIVIKGNGWTNFHYLRPKKTSGFELENQNVIFIPTITSNYTELLDKLMHNATNAMKIFISIRIPKSL
jgi:hypothetical protein